MIKIRAFPAQGFYRCGRHFSKGWQEFPDGAFTHEEMEVLMSEPMLEVQPADFSEEELQAVVADLVAPAKTVESDTKPQAAPGDDKGGGAPAPAETSGQCAHIKDGGEQCKNKPVEGSKYCRVHADEHKDEKPEE